MSIQSKVLAFALCAVVSAAQAQSNVAQSNFTQRDVQFYSEGVLCIGKLYFPNGANESSKLPAVVLAADARKSASSLESYATEIAAHGVVAFTFDYRGWGRSGGFLYYAEPVKWDDRLRFSQTTTKMRVRRQRLEPQLQLIDIRNAITFLQGEAGIDRTRIGVVGEGLSGDHAVVVTAIDARVKTAIAIEPQLAGKDRTRAAFAPNAQQQAALVKLARTGVAPANHSDAASRNKQESELALAEYQPYWYVDQIPSTSSVRFILNAKRSAQQSNVEAAAAVLKDRASIVRLESVRLESGDADKSSTKRAITEWLAARL